MLKKKKIIILIALITLILTLSQVSAETSPIQVRYVDQGNGQYTVQLDFTDIPKDNAVEYAQILLTCISEQHQIAADSLLWQASRSDLLVTDQFDVASNSLLVLIEPTDRLCAGVGSGKVFSFCVLQKDQMSVSPAIQLEAILILKDGTELEINHIIEADQEPSQPTVSNPTDAPTAAPSVSDPTDASTVPSDPSATDASTEDSPLPTTSATIITTAPSESAEVTDPSEQGSQTEPPANRPWIIVLGILAASAAATGLCLFYAKSRKAK